jgi:hypothetical protein
MLVVQIRHSSLANYSGGGGSKALGSAKNLNRIRHFQLTMEYRIWNVSDT